MQFLEQAFRTARIELIRRAKPPRTDSSNHVDRVKYHDLYGSSDAELQNWCKACKPMKFQVGNVLHDGRIYMIFLIFGRKSRTPFLGQGVSTVKDQRYTGFSTLAHAQPHWETTIQRITSPHHTVRFLNDIIPAAPHRCREEPIRTAPFDVEKVKTATHRTVRAPQNTTPHRITPCNLEYRCSSAMCSTPWKALIKTVMVSRQSEPRRARQTRDAYRRVQPTIVRRINWKKSRNIFDESTGGHGLITNLGGVHLDCPVFDTCPKISRSFFITLIFIDSIDTEFSGDLLSFSETQSRFRVK